MSTSTFNGSTTTSTTSTTTATDPALYPQLAIDLGKANLHDLAAVAGEYHSAAQSAHQCFVGLTTVARSHPDWTGPAADRFTETLGKLPAHLEQVYNGFVAVSQALTGFADEIEQLRSQYTTESSALADADTQLETAQGQLSCAQQDLLAAQRQSVGPARDAAIQSANQAITTYRRQVDAWTEQVYDHTQRSHTILDAFHVSREKTRYAVYEACEYAIVKPAVWVGLVNVAKRIDGVPIGRIAPGTLVGGAGVHAGTAAAVGSPLIPGSATAEVQTKLSAMNDQITQLMGTPYVWGGGHGAAFGPSNGGLDCSGFVSDVLHSGGYLTTPQTTTGLAVQPGLANGPGQYVTVYDRTNAGIGNDHVIMSINGHFFEEGGGAASGGAMNVHAFTPSPDYLASFNRVLHPVGL